METLSEYGLERMLARAHEIRELELMDAAMAQHLPRFTAVEGLRLRYLERIPDEVFALTALKELELYKLDVVDLPAQLADLPNLRQLHLQGCDKMTHLPRVFARLPRLERLELDELNALVDFDALAGLSGLRELKWWHYTGNAFPAAICRLAALQNLDIDGSFSELPDEIGALSQLEKARILRDLKRVPDSLSRLDKLESLMIGGSFSSLPESLWRMPRLRDLSILAPELTQLPPMGALKALRTLYMPGSGLKSLPDDLFTLPALQKLFLAESKLESLPATIGQARALEILDVDETRLTTIPPQIGGCEQLKTVRAMKCHLLSVPPELAWCKQLTKLHLDDNRLTTLPGELADLPALQMTYRNNPISDAERKKLRRERDYGAEPCPKCGAKKIFLHDSDTLHGNTATPASDTEVELTYGCDACDYRYSRIV